MIRKMGLLGMYPPSPWIRSEEQDVCSDV